MLGSALITVQNRKGTAFIGRDIEEEDLLINYALCMYDFEDVDVQVPFIRGHRTERPAYNWRHFSPVPPQKARNYPTWERQEILPNSPPYAGEKPERVFIVVPEGARTEDYGWLQAYPELYYPYIYFYQRTKLFTFVPEAELKGSKVDLLA